MCGPWPRGSTTEYCPFCVLWLVAQKNRPLTMLSFTVQSIGHWPLHSLTILDDDNRMVVQHRWLDSVFLLSDPILFLKNDIRIRSDSCFGWNHAIRIRKLSESVLWFITCIFVLFILPYKCLFCAMWQNNCWTYFAFGWIRSAEVVTWQVCNACSV